MNTEADNNHYQWPTIERARRPAGFPLLANHTSAAGSLENSNPAQPEPAKEPTEAELQALQKATDQGYAAGLESAQQAANTELARRTSALEETLASTREHLQSWIQDLEAAFSERCFETLFSIVGERLAAREGFFQDLLGEVAADLHADVESLTIAVATDLEPALGNESRAVVDTELAPGEIRVLSSSRVARLSVTELVANALQDLPSITPVDSAESADSAEATEATDD